jgi:hypothetical protein
MRIAANPASLLFVLMLVGSTAVLAKDPPAKESEKPAAKADASLDLKFPDVEGYALSEKRPLPGDGYSVAYQSKERFTITVYVYNRGLKSIPDDLKSKEVGNEMTGARDAIKEAVRQGYYQEVTDGETGETTLGKDGPKVLFAKLSIKAQGRTSHSEIYVMPFRNHFIKLRISYPAENAKTAAETLKPIYDSIGGMFAKPAK